MFPFLIEVVVGLVVNQEVFLVVRFHFVSEVVQHLIAHELHEFVIKWLVKVWGTVSTIFLDHCFVLPSFSLGLEQLIVLLKLSLAFFLHFLNYIFKQKDLESFHWPNL